MAWKRHRFFSCRNLGLDCDFLVRAESEEEIMKVAVDHSCRKHHLCYISPELKARLESNIKLANF